MGGIGKLIYNEYIVKVSNIFLKNMVEHPMNIKHFDADAFVKSFKCADVEVHNRLAKGKYFRTKVLQHLVDIKEIVPVNNNLYMLAKDYKAAMDYLLRDM